MRLLKNKDTRRLFVELTILILIFTVLIILITIKQIESYKQATNLTVSNIISAIKKDYPNVTDEEIIKILNNKNENLKENNILQKYGIDEKSYYILSMKAQETNFVIMGSAIVIGIGIIAIFIVMRYLNKRQAKIDRLTQYIQKIANKEYTIDIEDSSEDELDSLKSELYKITVMLKETADNSVLSRKSLSDSVSDISHQLKTPLTSILTLLDNVIESENMDNETKKKFLEEISRQVKDMNFLIISLLQLSRLDAGVVEFSNSKIDITKMIKEIKSNLDIIAEIKGVDVKIHTKPECYIYGDYNWNKEAIQNIIKNGIEHSKTEVVIDISDNSVYTKIEIIDDGMGINEHDIKHIFERFYKTKNSSENGVGIGLALAKNIIEKQNAYLTVESKMGEGTKFIIKYIKN